MSNSLNYVCEEGDKFIAGPGGYSLEVTVSLSTEANKACALLLFLETISEKKFETILVKSLFVEVIMSLENCFPAPAFSFMTFSYFCCDQLGISPCRSSLARDDLNLSRCSGINNICDFRTEIIID